MTFMLASTMVDIYRGVSTDRYGDEVDTNTIYASDLPAFISEQRGAGGTGSTQTSFLPASQRGGVVERYVVRFRPGAPVTEGDRIVEQRTGLTYLVQEVTGSHQIVSAPDVRALCVRVAAASPAPAE